jgi:hypothetical protein
MAEFVSTCCDIQHGGEHKKPMAKTHTIFEGTSEIQQLVIARAISGLRVE